MLSPKDTSIKIVTMALNKESKEMIECVMYSIYQEAEKMLSKNELEIWSDNVLKEISKVVSQSEQVY
jgi:hypothetical protein